MLLALSIAVFFAGFAVPTLANIRQEKGPPKFKPLLGDLAKLQRTIQSWLGIVSNSRAARAKTALAQEQGGQSLHTVDELKQRYSPDTWQREAFEQFATRITAKGRGKVFPCIYATRGFQDGEHRYVFLPSADPSEPRSVRVFAEALRIFIAESENIGPNTSLVAICSPPEAKHGMQDYNTMFWALLRGLRICDAEPWPIEIPPEVSASKWTFCFNGVPLFPVALTPLHDARRSRWSPNFTIALQPKWALDNLLATPEKRQSATGKVRALLQKYDEVDVSPDLTAYGDAGTSESNQLFLLDDNENPHGQCPFGDLDK